VRDFVATKTSFSYSEEKTATFEGVQIFHSFGCNISSSIEKITSSVVERLSAKTVDLIE
jgi:hypothetical protein